jgi:hypothetical protein
VSREPAVGGVTDPGGSGAMDSVGTECRSAGVTECGSAGLVVRLPGSGCLSGTAGGRAELTDSQSLVVSREPAVGGVTDPGGSGAMDSVGTGCRSAGVSEYGSAGLVVRLPGSGCLSGTAGP